MINIMKKHGKTISAYRLGRASAVLDSLIAEGKLRALPDGGFEVFSQETILGGSGHGQQAQAGDYLKIDGDGWPYPNEKDWFEKNHRHVEGDTYEQLPQPLRAWTADEPLCPEVEFLCREKGLTLDAADPAHYFRAVLWGTPESAPRDAVLVFYQIDYSADGTIQDADFNFVVRSEFDRTYDVI